MKTILLLLLFTSSLFSQKLWEIEVDPSDYLRDVIEIPNSDLLLFTYNTGKLEIRNSQDGSFVNQLIKKSNESGELRISNNGQLYYYQSAYDTLEYRNILTNEAIIRVSPEIEGLEGNPIFDSKAFQRFELFDNNTKIVGNMVYKDHEDSRNNVNYFIVFDIPSRTVEYKNDPYDERYMFIGKSYLSPDDKYFIETAYNKPFARMFNLETREYEFEFNGENNEEHGKKIGYLSSSNFINNNQIDYMSGTGYYLIKFPSLELEYHFELVSNIGIYPANLAKYYLCGNNLFFTTGDKLPGGGSQDYWFWLIHFDIDLNEVMLNYKEVYTTRSMFATYLIDNCSKIIIGKDLDNRNGIIACYDFNTLDIETPFSNLNYFSKEKNNIIFNSQEFIAQFARIEIFNSIGAIVGTLYSGMINQPNYTFPIPELPSGTYYLQCQLPNQNLNFNFVVVK